MWIRPIHYTCLVFVGAAIFLCRTREWRHSSVVFMSDLVLSSESWTGGSEHWGLEWTTEQCFLRIPHLWDAAAISGLDFEVEDVNVAFQIRNIYRTRSDWTIAVKPCAGNNNTSQERETERERVLPYKLPPPSGFLGFGVPSLWRIKDCQSDQTGFELQMGTVGGECQANPTALTSRIGLPWLCC